jgi:flagellar hook-associated protein 1 FlgK
MPSTFFGLHIAGSGLRAANANMNTTANNVSNADTAGYSRQQVTSEAATALRVFTTYGCAGAGVNTIAIERLRDSFYDTKFRDNETNFGEYTVKSSYMKTFETFFTDDGKTGFKTIFNKLEVALQEVLKNPGDTATKTNFVSNVKSMTEYFNNMYGDLQEQQNTINTEIKVKVDEINSLATEIANINKQINIIELTGTKANALRDKRDSMVDQLSQIIDVKTEEMPIIDANNENRETGATRYIVRVAGGITLVDGYEKEGLYLKARADYQTENQTDVQGLYDIYWNNGDKFHVSNASLGGSLAGLLQLRDGNNGEYFHGDVLSYTPGTPATDDGNGNVTPAVPGEIKVQVEADYLTDLNKVELPMFGSITIQGNQFVYSDWTYEKSTDANGKDVFTYTFHVDADKTLTTYEPQAGDESFTVGSIAYQGIPYYMRQMNEWVRNFSEAFNHILTTGFTDDSRQGVAMLIANLPDGTQSDYMTDKDEAEKDTRDLFYNSEDCSDISKRKNGVVNSFDDSYYRLTAGNFGISAVISNDPDRIATKKAESETEGESQYDNIKALGLMFYDKQKMQFRGSTAGDFLTSMLGDIALNANNADTFAANFTSMRNSLTNQRLSISGVDADEEAQNLIQYENSYTLASKVISTLTEMYDQLILQTGV